MGFWIFMLVMDLLIPVTMVFIGKKSLHKNAVISISADMGWLLR